MGRGKKVFTGMTSFMDVPKVKSQFCLICMVLTGYVVLGLPFKPSCDM